MNSNQSNSTLHRKLNRARQLAAQGAWTQFAQKLARNLLAPPAAALQEAYTLFRDRLRYAQIEDGGLSKRKEDRANGDTLALHYHSSSNSRSNSRSHPNVIWLMLDALRADIFAAYLQRGGLQSLAPQALTFPRAFAQGSWTYPSVFSFLTGRYPFNCGVSQLAAHDDAYISLCADFDESCPTLFSILRQQGYQIGSILDGWGYTVRNTAGQEHREDRYFEENWGWFYGQDRRFLTLQEQRDASVDFIRQAAPNGPFTLFLRSLYTHSPYREIFKSSGYVSTLSRRRWRFRIVEGFIRGLQKFEDVYINDILRTLQELNQHDNTIIILCSDHGDMFWDVEDDLRREGIHDEEVWRHQLEPYNGLIKVPLLIWGARATGVYPRCFRLIDILPTLLDQARIAYEPGVFDGVSLYSDGPRPLYADSAGYGNGGIAFQDQGPKLLLSRRLGPAAYDITPDNYERLGDRRDGRAQLSDMLEFVRSAGRYPDTILSPTDDAASPTHDALERRLKALGYL